MRSAFNKETSTHNFFRSKFNMLKNVYPSWDRVSVSLKVKEFMVFMAVVIFIYGVIYPSIVILRVSMM